MLTSPSFSVIIPAFNRERMLENCLQSIGQQTYRPYDIIVCDDGSIDNSVAVATATLNSLGMKHEVFSVKNGGPSRARRLAVERSSGNFLLFLDSDDLWDPEYIETVACALHESPSVNVTVMDFREVCGEATLRNSKFNSAPDNFWTTVGTPVKYGYLGDRKRLFTETLKFQPCFPSGLGISRGLYDQIGGIDISSQLLLSEDSHLTRKAFLHGKVYFIDRTLVTIQLHKNNRSAESNEQYNYARKLLGKAYVLRRIVKEEDLDNEQSRNTTREIFKTEHAALNALYWSGNKATFMKALRERPGHILRDPKLLLKAASTLIPF
ncbi:glycosyltransferase family 2 protein [Lamprobacter modestohalophilus]|uniref:glycosyltransferase family 2 protein n=1 Tax=Lamprobacter modestohalophilus TaxID=1064514 RepID=UPI002ADEB8C4|nr:glycosyltransferase family 2 protein [Lamprobacter modestohalophilus]MEA1050971.1 glycosyltransferase family 2 protein [Lamprobacter modestohalophilus]